ncbi:MAG: 23S rRNA (guanosine(2251)-2'-O)-methyltransferase RlmB [Candidatus Adiutrix sp.]|jgi:23S rRNA (guanosine2251-2'-O)-methyltransferase|nr:23S rRNA (guanosine(2251)-2'-O)-methyltransferase RlmB [Candidatus Adiutrix sp.]
MTKSLAEPAEAADGRTVSGLNPVLAALKNRAGACRAVFMAENRRRDGLAGEILALARAAGLAIRFLPRPALDRLCGRSAHQGVAAVFDSIGYLAWESFRETLPPGEPALVLALDRVEDPGNLGALMRSALAFGALGVLTPRDRSAPLTPAALKAAAGAAEVLPLVRAVNLRRALEDLKKAGFWLVGADGRGPENLFTFVFPRRAVIVLGSEGRGLSPLIRKICDFLVAVPQAGRAVPSLNVSVAGALFLAEFFRREHGVLG